MEREPAVHIHAANDAPDPAGYAGSQIARRACGYEKTAVCVASVEYGGLRAVLSAADPGIGIWGVLAGGGVLADHDCGVLLTPLFGKRIPVKQLTMSFVILAGIFLLQAPNLSAQGIGKNALALLPILVAAFSYPLGNRKMMQHCPAEMDTNQRVFGMTLASMPFWIAAAVIAWVRSGMPSSGQLLQSLGVALLSGVIATVLFFHATDLVKDNQRQLAVVEATQCGEVIFTLLGGILLLHDRVPDALGFLGIGLIVAGMILNSLLSAE